ncbi:MAG: recombination protein RecR [Vallitaleaceae bacterium]|nr:recombination protein RecR [Vallitaleaceae bacterium]
MDYYGTHIRKLIEEFSKLPGIGNKTAQRLAFYVINQPEDFSKNFASALVEAKKNTRYCSRCCTITDGELCPICRNEKRDTSMIMVVEESKDLVAYERTKQYNGLYHVLHGAISPMLGIGPNDIRMKELLTRLADDTVTEVILATNSTVEGEATAVYLSKILHSLQVKVTRIANGVPVGGDLEYVDEITLLRAFQGRKEM